MRISDWSSDVCSSDLGDLLADPRTQRRTRTRSLRLPLAFNGGRFLDIYLCQCWNRGGGEHRACGHRSAEYQGLHDSSPWTDSALGKPAPKGWAAPALSRSAELTSEPRSLIRTTYSVFCFK